MLSLRDREESEVSVCRGAIRGVNQLLRMLPTGSVLDFRIPLKGFVENMFFTRIECKMPTPIREDEVYRHLGYSMVWDTLVGTALLHALIGKGDWEVGRRDGM